MFKLATFHTTCRLKPGCWGILVILVNWCFDPSQPLGILSGLKEIFIKRYTVERTNKAKVRQEEQSERTESCQEDLWNEIQLKGP